MTESYGLFDAADPEAPDRVYTSEAFARLFRTMMRDGIVHNDGDELAVSPTVPAAMSVDVGTGMALVQGRYYINSADLTLAVEAADPSYPRIDRVVVRADLVGRTVHAVVKKGTAAASPVAPPLTRTTETWELSLAQVRVEAGATSIVAAKITDERGNASLCGVAAPVYVPSSQLEVVGAVDMQGKALTGLPAPSAGTDAAPKSYVDATISYVDATIPIGGIILWSGSITSIPSNWKLCDGSNGTPDLRDRFVVGAGHDYAVGETGGEATHVLTIDEMPAHSHAINKASESSGTSAPPWDRLRDTADTRTTSSVGGGQAHENRPPYYALAYIMRVA